MIKVEHSWFQLKYFKSILTLRNKTLLGQNIAGVKHWFIFI